MAGVAKAGGRLSLRRGFRRGGTNEEEASQHSQTPRGPLRPRGLLFPLLLDQRVLPTETQVESGE